jgi:tight adherence protein B
VIPVVVFAACLAGILGAYWFFVIRPEEKELGVVRRRLSPKQTVKASLHSELVKQQRALSSVGAFDKLLRKSETRTKSLAELIQQSGVKVTIGTVIAASALLALVAFYFTARLSGWAILGLPAAGLVAVIPFNILKYMRTLRMRKFEEQFPEALDLISRALRAGHAFPTGIEMAGTEMPSPVGDEFRLLYEQQNYGMPMGDALRRFAERIPVLDARFFVTAVLIQRERFRVKRQMRVASAHGRITGWVLVALPPVLAVVLMTVNQQHRELMFGERLGIQMMVGAAILQGIGSLMIRKICNIPY